MSLLDDLGQLGIEELRNLCALLTEKAFGHFSDEAKKAALESLIEHVRSLKLQPKDIPITTTEEIDVQ